MKSRKILITIVVFALMFALLVGCSPKSQDGVFRHVMYNSEEERFVETGNSIAIHSDYTYDENFVMSGDNTRKLAGNYVADDAHNLLYMEANDSTFDSFKRSYRTELKNLGYTASEIDNFIMPTLSKSGELYMYKDYAFKLGSINASREGEVSTVSELDGVYNFNGLLTGSYKRMQLKLGEIYGPRVDEFGNEFFDEKIGEYTISGDFITIKPTVATGGGKVNKPVRYLLADITLPLKYQDNVNDDGKYNGNNVITVYDNVKIKVIVGSFYTTRDIK